MSKLALDTPKYIIHVLLLVTVLFVYIVILPLYKQRDITILSFLILLPQIILIKTKDKLLLQGDPQSWNLLNTRLSSVKEMIKKWNFPKKQKNNAYITAHVWVYIKAQHCSYQHRKQKTTFPFNISNFSCCWLVFILRFKNCFQMRWRWWRFLSLTFLTALERKIRMRFKSMRWWGRRWLWW